MQPQDAQNYVLSLYEHILRRAPSQHELIYWSECACNAGGAEKVYFSFVNSAEYKGKNTVKTLYPAGHYYSPVVDPATVRKYINRERSSFIGDIPGVIINIREMDDLWNLMSGVIASTPFTENKSDSFRFYYNNNIFPYGDAISLRMMMAYLKPRSVVEIGSGFSSACMLDAAEEFNLDTKFTFIDPYLERLNSLLKTSDHDRVLIVEDAVQNVNDSLFSRLGAGDVVFIDSTHVLKTGSDVHFEIFNILPKLNSGVLIHFHDIQYPFEYPDQWIFEQNYSWNEIYALRAFLMYNPQFRIKFWGSCFAQRRTEAVRSVFPLFLKNPGGSIWIEKV